MEIRRELRVRMDTMSWRHFTCVFMLAAVVLAIALAVGAAGPPIMVTRNPGLDSIAVPLNSASAVCPTDASGRPLTPFQPRCWSHFFEFNSRWVQYFDVQTTVNRPMAIRGNEAELPLTLALLWQGQKSAGGPWETLYDGNVTRGVYCAPNEACSPMTLFRTNTVPYSKYFMRVSVPGDPIAWLDTADFYFRYRSADFAMFELGFKSFYLVTSSVALLLWVLYTGCDWGCGCWCCCKRAASNRLTFQRQQGVNWIYFLLYGLILFNQPLLWVQYYGPAEVFSFIGVGMQLSFVALLAAYWLVEFGLLKHHSNATGANGNGNGAAPSACAFYCPKLTAIFLYWLMALAVYGYILFKMQEDPLYNWEKETSAATFIVVWAALLAALYLSYLTWVMVRSCFVLRAMRPPERFLWVVHTLLVLTVGFGMAGGAIYGVEVSTALDFMFFNALFNVYVPLLAYLYTPITYTILDETNNNNASSLGGVSSTGGGSSSATGAGKDGVQEWGNTAAAGGYGDPGAEAVAVADADEVEVQASEHAIGATGEDEEEGGGSGRRHAAAHRAVALASPASSSSRGGRRRRGGGAAAAAAAAGEGGVPRSAARRGRGGGAGSSGSGSASKAGREHSDTAELDQALELALSSAPPAPPALPQAAAAAPAAAHVHAAVAADWDTAAEVSVAVSGAEGSAGGNGSGSGAADAWDGEQQIEEASLAAAGGEAEAEEEEEGRRRRSSAGVELAAAAAAASAAPAAGRRGSAPAAAPADDPFADFSFDDAQFDALAAAQTHARK